MYLRIFASLRNLQACNRRGGPGAWLTAAGMMSTCVLFYLLALGYGLQSAVGKRLFVDSVFAQPAVIFGAMLLLLLIHILLGKSLEKKCDENREFREELNNIPRIAGILYGITAFVSYQSAFWCAVVLAHR
jgi:hypothetical protein